MNIPETFHFDKDGEVVRYPLFRKLFLSITIALVALLAFGVGRLTGDRGERGVSINYNPSLESKSVSSNPSPATASVVYASSQGTKYYYPGCKSPVSEKNKVTFATAAMAEAAGYSLATGCKAPN